MKSGHLKFTVLGEAKPAGSKKGFVNPKTGGVIITDDAGKAGKSWRRAVQEAAQEAFGDRPLLDGPLTVSMVFYRRRPKSHFRSGCNSHQVKDSAPLYPTTRPDALKLARAAEDALTGIVWHDDALIVNEYLRKRYAFDGRPRVEITVLPL